MMCENMTNVAGANLLQSPTRKYTNIAKIQMYMKSQTNRAHGAGVMGVLCFSITSSVLCLKTPTLRQAQQVYNPQHTLQNPEGLQNLDFNNKYSPDLAPNPDRELKVIAAKKVSIPTNMSTTRAGLCVAMMMV